MQFKDFNLNVFKDEDGAFSWRKTGTALTFFVFVYACIGYLHTHHFNELPISYMGIIGGVFALYFFRKRINNGSEK